MRRRGNGRIEAVARSAPTLLGYARPMAAEGAAPIDLFRRGFELTYASELRAERKGRSGSIVDDDAERYRKFGDAALPLAHRPADAAKSWRRFRRRGKALTLARLAKATTTYAGGVDYIAWKINRHAGHGDRGPAVAAALADPRRARHAAASVAARRDPLTPSSEFSTASASAATVNGLRSRSPSAKSSASPASPT